MNKELTEAEMKAIRDEAEKKYPLMDRVTLKIMQPWLGYSAYVESVELKRHLYVEVVAAERQRSKELVEAVQDVLISWNSRIGPEKEQRKYNTEHDFHYWSPVASLVDSETISGLKTALSNYQNKTP